MTAPMCVAALLSDGPCVGGEQKRSRGRGSCDVVRGMPRQNDRQARCYPPF
jgi:hypothetical protein